MVPLPGQTQLIRERVLDPDFSRHLESSIISRVAGSKRDLVTVEPTGPPSDRQARTLSSTTAARPDRQGRPFDSGPHAAPGKARPDARL